MHRLLLLAGLQHLQQVLLRCPELAGLEFQQRQREQRIGIVGRQFHHAAELLLGALQIACIQQQPAIGEVQFGMLR